MTGAKKGTQGKERATAATLLRSQDEETYVDTMSLGDGIRHQSPRRRGRQGALNAHGRHDVLGSVIAGQSSFSALSNLSAIERAEIVERGVPARLLASLALKLHISHYKLLDTIGVSRATANRARRADTVLNPTDSEHAMGMARLVGQAEQIVQESGDPEGFDAGRWVAEFLETEHPKLGGRRPADLMRTSDGRAVVATLIAQMQSGAYA